MAEKEYNIKIKIDGAEQAVSSMKKITDNVTTSSKKIDDSIKNATSSIKNNNNSIISSFGNFSFIAGAVAASVGLMYKAISNASEAEDSAMKLSFALEKVGEKAKADSILKWADALEKSSRFSAEAIQDQYTYARSLGWTNEQAQKLVSTAMDLSAATGDTLDGAFTKLLKTTSGAVGSLGFSNIELKKLTEEQLRAGKAVDILADKFSGKSKQSMQTFSGVMHQLSVATNDLLEEFGNFIIKNERIKKGFTTTTTFIKNLINAMNDSDTVFGKFFQNYGKFINFIGDIPVYSMEKWNEWFFPSDMSKKANELKTLKKDIEFLKDALTIAPNDNGLKKELEDKLKLLSKLRAEYKDINDKAKSGSTSTSTSTSGTLGANGSAGAGGDEGSIKSTAISTQEQELNLLRTAQSQYETILKDRVALENQTNAEILASKYNFFAMANEATRANRELFTEDEANQFAAMTETYGQQDALRLMQLQQRIATETDAEKQITLAKQLEVEARIAESKKEAENEKAMSALKLATANQAITTGLAFAKKGSREQKNLMRAQTIMSTYTAASQALASPPGPPWTIPLAALITAQGFANLRNIDQQQFANGGIFNAGGTSISGDNVNARLNDREMILNMQQQRNLFNSINSGSLGSGLAIDAILSVKDAIIMQNEKPIAIDGELMNNKLTKINNRRLV